jgi:serine/threonine-protein kinase
VNERNFFSELKRRNVYKVAVAYAVVGWLVMQVASTVGPALHLPDSITTAVVVLVLLGFPIALVIAWAFEMTPEGMKRTADVSPDEKIPQWSARKFAAFILVVVICAAALLGYQVFREKSTPALEPISEKSIAVLPLVNQSGDPTQEYFSDGLSEKLINGLGEISQLRVIGRNSSFHFKGKTDDSRAIGQALGVANLLEGSVRKAGDRVRIGLQLVNAADGSQRWSETYDRELKDIFAIQEEIAKAVADQLRLRLRGGTPSISSQPSNANLTAYNFFLQARAEFEKANAEGPASAISLLDQAIALDPNYAEAYVLKARALYSIAIREGVEGRENFEKARAAVRAALALKPDLAGAHGSIAYIYIFADWNFSAAEAELAIVREKDATVLNNLAILRSIQGRLAESTALRQEVVRLEPLHTPFVMNLAQTLMTAERWDEAEAVLRRVLELQSSGLNAHWYLAYLAQRRGDLDAALREAELEPAGSTRDGAIAMVRFARGEREQADQALQQLIANFGERTPVSIAQVYAFRREPEKMFEWLDRAYQRRQPNLPANLAGRFYKPYYSDPRLIALCNKIGMPVPK